MKLIDNPPPWPGEARCAVAITWDLDADSGLNYYNPDTADTLQATLSYVRYGPTLGIPRLVKVLAELDLRQTFFIPGWCIEQYPETVDLLLENGHEVALHGYLHERPNELSAADEQRALDRALQAYEKHIGRRPRGWRAPSFAFSKHSLGYLLDAGFEYDSSLMGDDIPYLIADDARELLELPTQWDLDDWPHYMHNRDFRYTMPISAPARAVEVFRAEFDEAWMNGGLWISVWHPFLSGRPAKLRAVLDLIDYMRGRGDVWFARLDEVADHVKTLTDGDLWKPRTDQILRYTSPLPELLRPRT
jgi:peptidoglycan/xylan/chitin deacetylase (PgdA/CDA1 family)